MRRIALMFIFTFIVFLTLNCDKEVSSKNKQIQNSTKIDATSEASQKADSWLPEEDSTYKVIGYKKGLKGVTIKYSGNLYRGGNILSAEGAKILQENGIKTVISVTPDDNIKTLCNTFGFKNIDMFYDYGKLTDSITIAFLNVLDNEDSPLYIHCFSGKQRAGLLCAISRLYNDNWTFEQAEMEYGKLGGKVKEDHDLLVEAHNIIKQKRAEQAKDS